MKKRILMGILGLSILILSTNVNAETINSIEEGSNSTNASVIVGRTEAPVYSVEISWYGMTFDWKYDEVDKEYNWEQNRCVPTKFSNAEYGERYGEEDFIDYKTTLYTDPICNNLISQDVTYDEFITSTDNYYVDNEMVGGPISYVSIADKSTNGSIVPSIEWNSAENYDWTLGKFSYNNSICSLYESQEEFTSSPTMTIYTDANCTIGTAYSTATFETNKYYRWTHNEVPLTTKELPEDARNKDPYYGAWGSDAYTIVFNLDIDEAKEITIPKTGDTIGTITITIKAAE